MRKFLNPHCHLLCKIFLSVLLKRAVLPGPRNRKSSMAFLLVLSWEVHVRLIKRRIDECADGVKHGYWESSF
jgi:hypothetical protein